MQESWIPVWFLLTIWTPFVFCAMSKSRITQVAQETSTVISFMMGEDGMRFAQLIHELEPRVGAFQITQFMCSAWMKPVCTHTMGHGHKTVNTSPILADPLVWRSFSSKQHIFHWSPVLLPTPELLNPIWSLFLSMFSRKTKILLFRPNTDTLYTISKHIPFAERHMQFLGQV